MEAKPGSKHTLEFKNLDNIYNGRHGSVANELMTLVISTDGKRWSSVATRSIGENRVLLDVVMSAPKLFIARVEPYRLSDLDKWLASVKQHPMVGIDVIGRTVEGRELEIVRVGNANAPFHVFVRARAHPWESGGNWVAQGLVNRLLKDDRDTQAFRERYCLWLMPMTNKDGVVTGRTRFNLNGIDLNRGWDNLADPVLAPENHALEIWLEKQIKFGRKPSLALELHNDGNGKFHPARPSTLGTETKNGQIDRLENLLRNRTWFTEGTTKPSGTSQPLPFDSSENNCQTTDNVMTMVGITVC